MSFAALQLRLNLCSKNNSWNLWHNRLLLIAQWDTVSSKRWGEHTVNCHCLEYQEDILLHVVSETRMFLSNLGWICENNCCVLSLGQSSLSLQRHMIVIYVHAGCDIFRVTGIGWNSIGCVYWFPWVWLSLVPAFWYKMLKPSYLLVHPSWCLPTGAAFWQCHSLTIAIMWRAVWCRISHDTRQRFQFVGWKWCTSLDCGKSLIEGWPTQMKSKILRSPKV